MAFLDYVGLTHYNEKLKDSINDYTTGINLLRGTRDFVHGTETYFNKLNRWKDGWCDLIYRDQIEGDYLYKDEQGFTVLDLTNRSSVASVVQICSNVIEGLTVGDTITIQFEVMITETNEPTLRYIANINETNEANTRLKWKDFYIDGLTNAGPISNIELGKWYTITRTYTIQSEDTTGVYLTLASVYSQRIKFKKACIYFGDINDPVWSASPLDVAQVTDLASKADKDSINDFTTGINLLRGTRDFTEGRNLIPGNTSSLKSDGISYSTANWRIIHPDNPNEFSYAERLLTGQASHLYFNPIYKDDIGNNGLTMSAEIMFEAVPSGDVSIFQILPQDKASGGSYTSIYGGVNNCTEYTVNTMPLNEWFRIVLHIEQDKINIPDGGYLRIGLVGGSGNDATRYIRKVKLEPGIINNPIYSESPFDHPSIPVPINQGGTGAITSKAAQYNLFKDMNSVNTDASDSSAFIMDYGTDSSETKGKLVVRKANYVWNWIASKIKSVFGFNDSGVLAIEHGGTGGTTYKEAAYNLFSDIPNVSNMSGDRQFVVQHGSKSATAGAFARVKGNDIWDWIKSKIEADGSLGGGGLKYHEFTDTDFNKITEDGLYYIPRQYMKAKGLPKINVLSGNYEGGEGWVLAIDLFRDSTSSTINQGTRLTKFLCIGYFEGGDEDDDSGSFYSTYGTYLWEAGTYYYGGIKGAIKLSSLSTIQINN